MILVLFVLVLIVDFMLLIGVAISIFFPMHRIWPPPCKDSWQFYISWIISTCGMIGSPLIAIIDYNLGNLSSIAKAFRELGQEVVITKDVEEIKEAERLVLPGMGSFGNGMKNLSDLGLIKILKDEVLVKKKLKL